MTPRASNPSSARWRACAGPLAALEARQAAAETRAGEVAEGSSQLRDCLQRRGFRAPTPPPSWRAASTCSAAEIERLSLGREVAPEAMATDGLFGLAPAASKVYGTERGLSIGGYGEMLYQDPAATRDDGTPSGRDAELDLLRAILYFGYKFNDRLLFNSEIELEHTDEVELEFAYLDYLWRPQLNFRAGLMLLPIGLVNELHEPTVFLTARRPDVERQLIPTTWRENGFGVFGEAGTVSYRSYVVAGMDASGFSAAGLRGGRQEGGESIAEDFGWVGRLDWAPRPGLMVGGSLYAGDSGQGILGPAGAPARRRHHARRGPRRLALARARMRALAARAELDDVAALDAALGLTGTATIGEAMEGFYVEAGYDVLAGGERSLTPYLRWEQLDTQAEVPAGFRRDPARDSESLTLGLSLPADRAGDPQARLPGLRQRRRQRRRPVQCGARLHLLAPSPPPSRRPARRHGRRPGGGPDADDGGRGARPRLSRLHVRARHGVPHRGAARGGGAAGRQRAARRGGAPLPGALRRPRGAAPPTSTSTGCARWRRR